MFSHTLEAAYTVRRGLGIIEEPDPMLMTTPFPRFTIAGKTMPVIRVTDTVLAFKILLTDFSLVTKELRVVCNSYLHY